MEKTETRRKFYTSIVNALYKSPLNYASASASAQHHFPLSLLKSQESLNTKQKIASISSGLYSDFMMSMEIKELASSPPRSGRDLQRYNNKGFRLIVGCIPYRRTLSLQSHANPLEDIEVLLISSQKSSKLMFPKGGWELDEDIQFAAARETLEESGVVGKLEVKLGEWTFKSKSQDKFHKGSLFSMLVTEELDDWPEKNVRHRVWMNVKEAREACVHWWMREALDAFVCEMARPPKIELEKVGKCCRKEEVKCRGSQSLTMHVDGDRSLLIDNFVAS